MSDTEQDLTNTEGQSAEQNPSPNFREKLEDFFESDWTEDSQKSNSVGNVDKPSTKTNSPEPNVDDEDEYEEEIETDTDEDEAQEEDQPEDQPEDTVEPTFKKLLDIKIKRHDEVKSVKDWLSSNPELSTEIFGQVFDYASSKREVKDYLSKKMEEVEEAKSSVDMLVLQNLAYQANMPLKTLEDFESDTRCEDPQEAFEEYQNQLRDYIGTVKRNKTVANMENEKMFESFSSKYSDVDPTGLIEMIQPYLNASVSSGQLPFPPDALEIFYKGKNFDAILSTEIQKARIEERKKVIAELKGKPKGAIPQTTSASRRDNNVNRSGLGKYEREFEEAFD